MGRWLNRSLPRDVLLTEIDHNDTKLDSTMTMMMMVAMSTGLMLRAVQTVETTTATTIIMKMIVTATPQDLDCPAMPDADHDSRRDYSNRSSNSTNGGENGPLSRRGPRQSRAQRVDPILVKVESQSKDRSIGCYLWSMTVAL